MKKSMKSTLKLSLLTTLLLIGCGQDKATVESNQPEKELSIVEQKNAQEWEDGRIYITEHNYVRYQDNNGKPRHYVFKAKEWPREDLDNESSYDLPRIVFRWDNGEGETDDYYERKDKVWSIKTDGTDLRLVADEFDGEVRVMRMSPNNRYLAISYSTFDGIYKVIKDLKTNEYIELGRRYGRKDLLWSEKSDYLYFYEGRKSFKYNVLTKKIEDVDVQFNQYSVISNENRFVVNDFGVAVYDEKENALLYSIGLEETSDTVNEYDLRKRGVSPTGKYAWGESYKYRFLIDVENRKIDREEIDRSKPGDYEKLNILSLDAKFARSGGAAKVFLFHLDENKKIKDYHTWRQIGSGHSATEPSLYNAFANDGNFEKNDVHSDAS
ncbi:Tricorn protease domain-containing protein [Photobacterium sp. 2_MG-2023]|uniref:Tricorn protease domain-containing protein n=1 Tax=Photobacterium sp. 2_MG-2023 TaxID=3062663 RepID=UPI0026E3783B|nr:Tricorn protease domain-containing protein [Photobacterium sp. 2_MG-2023]MDO6583524.1 Tricorn protease domain-containing protein [Photobacterium sp. 2_MG-2023]